MMNNTARPKAGGLAQTSNGMRFENFGESQLGDTNSRFEFENSKGSKKNEGNNKQKEDDRFETSLNKKYKIFYKKKFYQEKKQLCLYRK